jgi:DNA-binding PadR family transcriptional regulator
MPGSGKISGGPPGGAATPRGPTELEGCVLGVLATVGPCTAYVVRRTFLESPSPSWSGSAGAIYPLLRRLRGLGFVEEERRSAGRRRSLGLSLTPAGRAALAGWMRPPLPDVVIGVPSDPLRTRLGFLAVLAPAERRVFLADAAARMAAHLEDIEADEAGHHARGDVVNRVLARGARQMQAARVAWLREATRALGGSRPVPSRRPRRRRAP